MNLQLMNQLKMHCIQWNGNGFFILNFSESVYLGVRFESENHQIGNELVWWGFSSCATNRHSFGKENYRNLYY